MFSRAKNGASMKAFVLAYIVVSSIAGQAAAQVFEVDGNWYDFSYTQTTVLNAGSESGFIGLKNQPWWVSTDNGSEQDDADHYPYNGPNDPLENPGGEPLSYWDGVDSSLAFAATEAAGAYLNAAAGDQTVYFGFHIDADGSANGDQYSIAAYYWDGSAVANAEGLDLEVGGTYNYATAAVTSEPTAVPEINGSTIPLLAFILGVIGLGLKKRHAASFRDESGMLAAA